MKRVLGLCIPWFIFLTAISAQAPHLFLSAQDIENRAALAKQQPWARDQLNAIVTEANSFPATYDSQYGVKGVDLPPEGGQWLNYYVCKKSGTPLQFEPPNRNVCPDDGTVYHGYPYDQVIYARRADDLAHGALTEALAFRLTGNQTYAVKASLVLNAYAKTYLHYAVHDNSNGPGRFGGRVYSQTLDESLWLVEICWTYDLVRGSGVLSDLQKEKIERDLLRASAETVGRASSPSNPSPSSQSDNIQSWVNTAVAAVGYETKDPALIQQALDGPRGFHYQMHNKVVDGFWIEGAFGYQFYAMRALAELAQMARQAGTDLWSQEPNLLELFLSPPAIAFPDGSLPAFNDSHTTNVFDESDVYIIAYSQTDDPRLLPVLRHSSEHTRESFLFGRGAIAEDTTPKSSHQITIFPQAGYAVERGCNSDLTAIMKFGPHGGTHGHFDLLNELIYADGHLLSSDPGTHNYSLPIHSEWDKTTVAHNTISIDEAIQNPGRGKLTNEQKGDCFTTATASTDEAYPGITLTRTLLSTSEYVVEVTTGQATDGKDHRFDWNYHNYGSQSITLKTSAFDGLPKTNGYQYLSAVRRGISSQDIQSKFTLSPASSGGLYVTMLGGTSSEVLTGVAPDVQSKAPVPFLIVRRTGRSARFVAVLQPFSSKSFRASVRQTAPDSLAIRGPGWTDTIRLAYPIEYSRTLKK